jgi:tetratricopeptide (TPR) repeat protein/transcriptional regulator with XRE-family HTH domain
MFGQLVLEHRRRLGLTQEELAEKSGLSARTIRGLEAGQGRMPRAASVRLLATALGLHGAELDAFVRAASGPEEVPTAASLDRPDDVAADAAAVSAPAGGRAVRCLPRPATHFTGRDPEVTRLLSAVDRCRADRSTVVAVDGMAGVGKTALALELAHRLADRYPGGHLFVDLHGHSTHSQLEPSVALGLLLTQLGVPAHEVPETLEGRVARWRSEVAGRPVLTVLDNAASSEQIRPLVPGRSAALVLVTSRRRLVGLDSDEHATLEPLDDATAVSLLARLIGEQRLSGHDSDAREVARLCGNLPLALRITAARLRHRPTWTVADLGRRLRTARPPVVELSAEGTTVAAALTLSYRQLSEPAGSLLRGLGLHAGEDFDEHTAAALVDSTPADVRAALDELLDAHLLQDRDDERYRLHDLVRDYAARLAARVDDEAGRRAAVRRLLEYYLHSTVADLPDGTVIDGLHTPDWGPPSRHRRVFATEAERVRWEEAEWRNVLAAVGLAESFHMDRLVCLLARAVWGFHWRRGNAGILIRLQEAALMAARRLGDTHLTAMAHNYLAGAHTRCGQMSQGRHHLDQALRLWRAAGSETAELLTVVNLMTVNLQGGRFEEVIAHGRWVLEQPERAGEDESLRRRIAINRAVALRLMGECHIALGRYRTALRYLRQALRHHGDLGGKGHRWALVLFELGRAHARLDHRVVAPLLLRRATASFEETGNESGAAEALAELGIVHLRAGNLDEARRLHEAAVERMERSGSPQSLCYALNRLGGTLLRRADADSAAALHRKALTIARRIDARYEEAVAHLGLAKALATVDPRAADRHRREGTGLFAAMRAVDPYHVAAILS